MKKLAMVLAMVMAVEAGRQACYDTFAESQANAYKTFEEKGMSVTNIDQEAAMAACVPVILKYCEDDAVKAAYEYVQAEREKMGFAAYVGMEDHMDVFGDAK